MNIQRCASDVVVIGRCISRRQCVDDVRMKGHYMRRPNVVVASLCKVIIRVTDLCW